MGRPREPAAAPAGTTCMSTKLERIIRREIEIDGEPYTVAISPIGVRLTKKRFRSGVALTWKDLWSRGEHTEESSVQTDQD
jgi:hypothetical protein